FNPRPPLLAGESPLHVTPCHATVFAGTCANLAVPSCVLHKKPPSDHQKPNQNKMLRRARTSK
ncbi:MAG: hypothetical protein LC106_11185, partial [Burkholderiales bacterium]|nr:hypothetical protein [Burkholderiales bacterium]